MTRRGQAALEYLVTYGWAFLAILVAFGALSAFGLLTPTKYLPARCEFGVQLQCADYLLQEPDTILLRFRNSFGDDINITSIVTDTGVGTLSHLGSGDYRIPKGNVTRTNDPVTVTLDNTYPLVGGERQSVVLIVTFKRDMASAPDHTVKGEIFATVQ